MHHLDSASTFVRIAQRIADFFLAPYRINMLERELRKMQAEREQERDEIASVRVLISALRADVARLIGHQEGKSGVWESVGQGDDGLTSSTDE